MIIIGIRITSIITTLALYLIFKYFDLVLDLQCDMIHKAFVKTSRLSRNEFASDSIKLYFIVLMISSHLMWHFVYVPNNIRHKNIPESTILL